VTWIPEPPQVAAEGSKPGPRGSLLSASCGFGFAFSRPPLGEPRDLPRLRQEDDLDASILAPAGSVPLGRMGSYSPYPAQRAATGHSHAGENRYGDGARVESSQLLLKLEGPIGKLSGVSGDH